VSDAGCGSTRSAATYEHNSLCGDAWTNANLPVDGGARQRAQDAMRRMSDKAAMAYVCKIVADNGVGLAGTGRALLRRHSGDSFARGALFVNHGLFLPDVFAVTDRIIVMHRG
jgi:hypothetical protein